MLLARGPGKPFTYRGRKEGPISSENYAKPLEQNREFGIVDQCVRSSSVAGTVGTNLISCIWMEVNLISCIWIEVCIIFFFFLFERKVIVFVYSITSTSDP